MTLEVIGQKLKAAREAQGLSLRQIYERTKIPINHLQSIDGGQSEDLPEPVYVAGFIKRYAECIGLDGQILADEFRKQGEEQNGNGNGKGHGKTAPPPPAYTQSEYLRHSKLDRSPPQYKLWSFNGLMGVLLLAVIWFYIQTTKGGNQTDPSLQSLRESTATLPATAPGTTAGTQPQVPVHDGKVTLTSAKHVWLDVKALSNGESLFTGYMEQGDKRDFEDKQGLRVVAGNGGSLSVEFKGKIEPFGASGKRTERSFVATTDAPVPDPAATATTTTSSESRPAPVAVAPVRRRTPRKAPDAPAQTSQYRPLEDSPSRQIPGESGGDGGTRSIDVPYRYSEGRLDAN